MKNSIKKAILKERLYVPKRFVTEQMKEAYSYILSPNGQKTCQYCSYFFNCPAGKNPTPLTRICDQFYSESTIELKHWKSHDNYVSFCRGDFKKLIKTFRDFKIIDKRSQVPMPENLNFLDNDLINNNLLEKGYDGLDVKKLKNQKKVANDWIKKGYGQIKCPARYGKTVLVAYIICELQQRALVLAHQVDLLIQFQEAFELVTNWKQLSSPNKKIGIWRKEGDSFFDLVTLATWQSFNSIRGREELKEHKNDFGLVFVDESHCSAAEMYSQITNRFNARFRGGCTATEKRKDELHIVVNDILGPVVAEGKTQELVAEVKFFFTNIQYKYTDYVSAISFLSINDERNKLIIDNVVSDIEKGYYVLVILERIKHFDILRIELEAKGYKVGTLMGKTINRKQFLQDARNKKFDVLLAQRRIMKHGINIPPLDCLHTVIPGNDPYGYYQELSRIRSKHKNKKTPKIVDYIDSSVPFYAMKKTRERVYRENNFIFLEESSASYHNKTKNWGGGGK